MSKAILSTGLNPSFAAAALLLCSFTGCGEKSPMDLFKRAMSCVHHDRDEEALQLLNQAIALKPDFGEAIGERGVIYAHRDQYGRAMKDLSMAIDFLPRERGIMFRYERMLACREQGGSHAEMAIQDCSVVIEQHTEADSTQATAFGIRAWAYSVLKKHKAASKDASAALANPHADDWTRAEAFTYRANSSYTLGDYDRAIKDCTEVIKLNPSHSGLPYLIRSMAYLSTGQKEQAAVDRAAAQRMEGSR